MVKWRKLSQGNFAISKAFACAPDLRVTATKCLVKVLWGKGSFWPMDLRFCPWLLGLMHLGRRTSRQQEHMVGGISSHHKGQLEEGRKALGTDSLSNPPSRGLRSS